MNENIDLTKILDRCPVGTKLYSTTHGIVTLQTVEKNKIIVSDYRYCTIDYSKEGRYCPHIYGETGECTLFPSREVRDWSKFERFWDKPKVEKFDPNTLQPFDKVLAKDYAKDVWTACLYSHHATELDDGWFVCDNTYWRFVIPYNDDTKHLVGTKNDCPEYYKWWKE